MWTNEYSWQGHSRKWCVTVNTGNRKVLGGTEIRCMLHRQMNHQMRSKKTSKSNTVVVWGQSMKQQTGGRRMLKSVQMGYSITVQWISGD